MAIDYTGYAQSFGGRALDTSGIERGIERWRQASQENALASSNKFMSNFITEITKPYADLAYGDINDLRKSGTMPTLMNAGAAYQKFKTQVDALPNMQKKAIYNSGIMNALAFKQEFDAAKNAYIPMFEKKLEAYKLGQDFNNRDTRNFISEIRGLDNFLINNGNPAGVMRELALPYHGPMHGWKKWWRDDWTAGGVAGAAAAGTGALGLGAYGTYKMGKKAFSPGESIVPRAVTSQADPFGIQKRVQDAKKLEESYQKMDKRTKPAKRLKTIVDKAKLRPEASLKAAEEQIESVFTRAGKSKSVKNYFTKPGGWKNLIKGAGVGTVAYMGANAGARQIAGALGAGEAGKDVAGQAAQTTITASAVGVNHLIKKKGLPWLLSKLTKKAGVGFALRLAGKLGLATIGGVATGGIATALSAGLLANDLRLLYKYTQELMDENKMQPSAQNTNQKAGYTPYTAKL